MAAILFQWWVRGASVLLAVLLCAMAFPAGVLGYWGLANLWPRGPDGYLESHLLAIDDWAFTPARAAAWGGGVTVAALLAVVATLWLGWSFQVGHHNVVATERRE